MKDKIQNLDPQALKHEPVPNQAETVNLANRASAKKQYKAPTLVEHGSVRELTQTGGSKASDGFGTKRP